MERGAPAGLQPGRRGRPTAADHVAIIDRPEVVGRSHGRVHPDGSPHIRLDPRNILLPAVEFAGRLERLDPSDAEAYRARLASFRLRWTARAVRLVGMPVVVHIRLGHT